MPHSWKDGTKGESGAASAGRPILIIGGAGFVGSHLASHLLSGGRPVHILDNLARDGSRSTAALLRARHGSQLTLIEGDIRDPALVREAVRGVGSVHHFAAQIASTTSMANPLFDADVNIRGTLHVLEALRHENPSAPLVFASTHKVYGPLDDLAMHRGRLRYQPADAHLRRRGINEHHPLSLTSAYGCSRAAADQYVIDYARHYDLRATVFRVSTVYGSEAHDQASWPRRILDAAIEGKSFTVYGDGRQVRDMLFIDDLVEAFLRGAARIEELRGRVYNLGGGPRHSVSLLELIDIVRRLHGDFPDIEYADWRPGDQRYYASDATALSAVLRWKPEVEVRDGIERLYDRAVRRSLPTIEHAPERRRPRADRITEDRAYA